MKIEQPRVDVTALLQVSQNSFSRFFRKPTLSGASDDD